jgi:hypothetical protein
MPSLAMMRLVIRANESTPLLARTKHLMFDVSGGRPAQPVGHSFD